jgi:hypothetical protein
MPTTITGKNSIYGSATAFTGSTITSDTLTVNADGYLISETDHAVELTGLWTVKVNGTVGVIPTGAVTEAGIALNSTGSTKASNITVGADGDVFGDEHGILTAQTLNVTVAKGGAISGQLGSGVVYLNDDALGAYKITNAGLIQGGGAGTYGIDLGGLGTRTIVNSGTISGGARAIYTDSGMAKTVITNSGTLINGIELAGADDSLTNSNMIFGDVQMGEGKDTVTNSGTINGFVDFGAGNADDVLKNTKSIVGNVLMGDGKDTVTNSGTIGDSVDLGAGNDTLINSGKIVSSVELGDGNDTFKNTGTVLGSINLGAGDDIFTGGNQGELITDAQGADKYSFGGGFDVFFAVNPAVGNDIVDGGAGTDQYDAGAGMAGVQINLDTISHTGFGGTQAAKTATGTEIGTDTITGFEFVVGTTGNDLIFGNGAANTLSSVGGNDELYGYGGNDTLNGGDNDDLLIGGAGRDKLSGGTGNDTYYFLTLADSGKTAATRDLIVDFEVGADKIHLNLMDANTKMSGDQNFTWIATDGGFGAFTKTAGELHLRMGNGNTIIEGDVNGDGKADFQIELAGHRFDITGADFIL